MSLTHPDDEPPKSMEARGFVLCVGVDEAGAAAAGTTLAALVEELKALTAQLVPTAETYAAVTVTAGGSTGRDLDAVRRTLRNHTLAPVTSPDPGPEREPAAPGVVIDISRKRVTLDEEVIPVTYKEFELLQFLVLREGQTVHRSTIIDGLWAHGHAESPGDRTIDVHIRRLRSKLGEYGGIVRTVRRAGYRFDRHPDVVVRYASTPSPDTF